MAHYDFESIPRGPVVAQMELPERMGIAMRRLVALQGVLEEVEAELDRQLYDDEHVRSCRNNDLDIAPDCEHQVIIKHETWDKIQRVLRATRGEQ